MQQKYFEIYKVVQQYSHFIQYPSESEPHESGTNLVQKKGKAGEAPFYAASRDH